MPDYIFSFKDTALEDVELAVEWYEQQAYGLGKRFEKSLGDCLQSIGRYPENHPFHTASKQIRKIRLYKFPYRLFYIIDGFAIVILAVIHTSRSDRFVKKRLS